MSRNMWGGLRPELEWIDTPVQGTATLGIVEVLLPDGKWHQVGEKFPDDPRRNFYTNRNDASFKIATPDGHVLSGPLSSVLATKEVPLLDKVERELLRRRLQREAANA